MSVSQQAQQAQQVQRGFGHFRLTHAHTGLNKTRNPALNACNPLQGRYSSIMNIHDMTKQLIKEHNGFVPSTVLMAAVRAHNPELSQYPDYSILRAIAEALKGQGLGPKNGRVNRRIVRGYGDRHSVLRIKFKTFEKNI
jgi:hypothetical protein